MKRNEILKAAYDCFVDFGYKGTTMEKVAKIANVGKGTIYTFFKNKEELLEELVKIHLNELKGVAESLEDGNLGFEENLQKILFGIFKLKKENQLIIKLIQEEKSLETKEVKKLMFTIDEEIISYIKYRIQKGILKGEIKECDIEVTSFIIMKIYIALIFDWEERNEPFKKEKLFELLNLYILKGIKK